MTNALTIEMTREQFDKVLNGSAKNPGYVKHSDIVFQHEVTVAGKTTTQTWLWNQFKGWAEVFTA